MALDAPTLVRAGGGIAVMAAGAVALAGRPARARSGHVPLGLALLLFGAAFAIYNFLAAWGAPAAALTVEGWLFLACAGALVAFVLAGPWSAPGEDRRVARGAVGIALGVALVAGIWTALDNLRNRSDASMLQAYLVNNPAGSVMTTMLALVAVLAAWRARRASDPSKTRALAALAFGLCAWQAFFAGSNLRTIGPLASAYVTGEIVTLAVVIVAWVLAAPRGGAAAWIVPWGLLASALYGEIQSQVLGFDSGPGAGIMRAAGALAVIYALLSGVLDGAPRERKGIPKSTLAAAALATLFIVAQIAQNFLSAEYGLLTGGVVAGAFLFAASPLQRAMERLSASREDARASATAPATAAVSSENEDAYRRALRIALRDRLITPDEEVHLADLGERLGIRAGRAQELRHEIEREHGGAR